MILWAVIDCPCCYVPFLTLTLPPLGVCARGITPGQYKIFARDDGNSIGGFYNDDFLKSVKNRGKSVPVGKTDFITMDVTALTEPGQIGIFSNYNFRDR